MEVSQNVLEYKCPCCGAGLKFAGDVQEMTCEYCDNSFSLDTIQACQEADTAAESTDFQWEETQQPEWSEDDSQHLKTFICQSCGGSLISDENTAATFCPFCENPAILPERLSADLRPQGVIPFRKTKEDAVAAFQKLCKGKPLLPKSFAQEHRLEKLTGIYVPFWLYDCKGSFWGQYRATRMHTWSDTRYHYTKTDHFLLTREASADFCGIPMDGSTKMDNAIMESIEPFDHSQIVDFETAYLSGFFADKYDVDSSAGHERVEQRVADTLSDSLSGTMIGYASVTPTGRKVSVSHGSAKYVLMPVWVLFTKYKDKVYQFAMNGQTGKMTGTFPICPKRSLAWFSGIFAGVAAVTALLMQLF